PAGIVVVITGALYFADREMKTADNFFRGFPALWNAAAFYLFLLKPMPALAAVIVVALAVLTFVPFKFLHPLRVARLRALTIAALTLWSLRVLARGRGVEGGWGALGLFFPGGGLPKKR